MNERTDGLTKRRVSVRPSVRSFVCLFVRPVSQRRPSYGETNRDSEKFKGIKILDQPINRRHLVSWLSGKWLKLLPTDVTFYGWNSPNSIPASVRPFVRPSVS